MRRLLSGATALAIASTIAFAGMATAAEEPGAPEVMAVPAVLINEVSTMGPNGPLDEAIEIINTTDQQLDLTNWVLKVYNQQNQVIQTIPLVDALGQQIVLAPKNNVGSTLVLTGAEFSGTTNTPHVLPVNFMGVEGIPVYGGVAIFGSNAADRLQDRRRRVLGERGHSQGERQRRSGNRADRRAERLEHPQHPGQDTNNNQRDFSLQERTF